jgi:hypothetical protein
MARTGFAGTTAQEAIDQGYIRYGARGEPGEAGFGTMISLDLNGSAPDVSGQINFEIVLLEGAYPFQIAGNMFIVT